MGAIHKGYSVYSTVEEERVHTVRIAKAFAIGRYEVTFGRVRPVCYGYGPGIAI
jgi:formylglycine-generating enzyme required for sulfatase activity